MTERGPLGHLLRWEDAGGTWQVTALSASHASVSLCRCDGGEEIERLTSADPELLAYLARRPSSEDAAG